MLYEAPHSFRNKRSAITALLLCQPGQLRFQI